jgi:septin family protein
VQETPGLKGNAHDCANALCNYLHQEQQQYAEQELGIHIPRDNLLDGRVDVVLYFLPINARISEDDLDTIVMNAMSEYAPVIPVMARVRRRFSSCMGRSLSCSFQQRLTETTSACSRSLRD